MKYLLVIASIILLFFSCTLREEKVDIEMDKDQLINLITDMHYLEAIVKKTDRSQKDSVKQNVKEQIKELYGFDSMETMDSLINKAQSFPIFYKGIQITVSKHLDSIENALNNKIKDKK